MPWVPFADAGAEFDLDVYGGDVEIVGSTVVASLAGSHELLFDMFGRNELALGVLRVSVLEWSWEETDPGCGEMQSVGALSWSFTGAGVENTASDPLAEWQPTPVTMTDTEGYLSFWLSFNECGGSGSAVFLIEVWQDGTSDLIANDDAATTPAMTAVDVDVLANDTLNGGPASVGDLVGLPTVVSPPANGTAIVHEDGTITYEPEPGFCGTDSFVYEIETTDEDTCLYADLPCMSDSVAYVQGAIPSWWPTVDPYDYEAGTTGIGGQNAGLGFRDGLPALVSMGEYPLRCGEYLNLEVTFADPEIGPTQYIACLSLRCEDAGQELIVRDLTIDESQRPELELVDGFAWGETEELYLNFNSGGPTVIFAWDGGVNRYVLLDGEPDPSEEGDRAGTIAVNNPVCFFFRWESEG